jgi:hypothetical protein
LTEDSKPLTQADLESAQPGVREDGSPCPRLLQVAGNLYLQITPGKDRISRSWIFKFKVGKKRTGMGLGSLADVPLEEALYRARQKQEQVDRGENPIEEERRAERKREAERARPADITFAAAAEAYADAHKAEWTPKDYKRRWLAVLERHAFPEIGKTLVVDITVEHVLRVLEPLWARGMTKTGKDHPRPD